MSVPVRHLIAGAFVEGLGAQRIPVSNPLDNSTLAEIACASAEQIEQAVASARETFASWKETPVSERARVMLRYQALLKEHHDELAKIVSSELGKTFEDAKGDVWRGIEVVEHACNVPSLLMGETVENVARNIDTYSITQPLGVCVGITPFNFPAMIPLWKLGPAIACGNAFILKPSERDPGVPMRLAELFIEAGGPPVILNVVNGDKEAVDALIGAGYGSAGERCMAISVAVPVGNDTANRLMDKLIPRVESLKVGPSTDSSADFGPVVTAQALERIKGYVDLGVKEGATLAVDGRGFKMQGYENGYYMGGCLFDNVTPDMRIYKEEIFGPVLSVLRADTYEEALKLTNDHEYGNGTAIFTRDGDAARDFAAKVNVGMVGINVPIPVPLAYYTFGGWKRSGFGDLNQHGPDSIRFYTKTKTVTSRWPSGIKDGASFVIPTMG